MSINTANIYIIILITVAILLFGFVATSVNDTNIQNNEKEFSFEKFDSESEYKSYLNQDINKNSFNRLYNPTPRFTPRVADSISGSQESMESGDTSMNPTFKTRQTNIQEKGVGEPDIVKVLDNKTYYSRQGYDYAVPFEPRARGDIKLPEAPSSNLYSINNPNRGDFNVSSELDIDGKILRNDNNLIVYNDENITGFKIQNDDSILRNWNKSLNNSNNVVTTRRIGTKSYFVVKESVKNECTYNPVGSYTIDCTDIYRPNIESDVDTTYTVFSLDMKSGNIEDEISFIGSNGETSVYMSSDSIYVSYGINNLDNEDIMNVIVEDENLTYSKNTEERIKDLKSYNISNQAKMTELREIVKDDDNLDMSEIQATIEEYISNNKRDIFRTSIVKLNVNDSSIEKSNTGTVPGSPLNQFSFDEKGSQLRVATTIKPSNQDISSNDVYILNSDMNVIGSEKNMAEGQRIYAVRFIGDKGYVITYRQVDPLHVLNLSDSTDPREVGKLKLPGFSEYLHKVGDGLILGVGESQDSKGKLVLFNVSNESNPKIADDLILDNTYSTEVSNNHHAFMQDSMMNNVYVPSNNKMFVVNYDNNKLDLVSKINTNSSDIKRTRIYEDDIVVFSSDSIIRMNRNSYDITQKLNIE